MDFTTIFEVAAAMVTILSVIRFVADMKFLSHNRCVEAASAWGPRPRKPRTPQEARRQLLRKGYIDW